MNFEELEELEELSDLDDIEENSGSADYSILSVPCVHVWQTSYENSGVPFAVLDAKLRIVWANDSYNRQIGRGTDLVGEYFTKVFYHEKNQFQIDLMYKNIFLSENGYSWKGKLETGSREHLTIIVNTLSHHES